MGNLIYFLAEIRFSSFFGLFKQKNCIFKLSEELTIIKIDFGLNKPKNRPFSVKKK